MRWFHLVPFGLALSCGSKRALPDCAALQARVKERFPRLQTVVGAACPDAKPAERTCAVTAESAAAVRQCFEQLRPKARPETCDSVREHLLDMAPYELGDRLDQFYEPYRYGVMCIANSCASDQWNPGTMKCLLGIPEHEPDRVMACLTVLPPGIKLRVNACMGQPLGEKPGKLDGAAPTPLPQSPSGSGTGTTITGPKNGKWGDPVVIDQLPPPPKAKK